jgi:hypothetical protein
VPDWLPDFSVIDFGEATQREVLKGNHRAIDDRS